jgi:hypothetical protein
MKGHFSKSDFKGMFFFFFKFTAESIGNFGVERQKDFANG